MTTPFPTSAPSRRSFLRLAGLAASLPILGEGNLAWAALQQSASKNKPPRRGLPTLPSGAVAINANENPLGPCSAALAAIHEAALTGGRYDAHGGLDRLAQTLAKQTGLPADHIAIYAGSTEPLYYSVLAFTSPAHSYVTADPTFETGMFAAAAAGAHTVRVPLNASHAHDIKAMVAADPAAGLIYICNPNNPTGTLTPREDIVWAADHKPRGSILLVDEAYIHLCDAPSVLDLVAAGKDVIVLRTFSKVYGMAGIRCGMAIGRPDLLEKLQRFGMNFMPVTAVAAATASLNDAALVPARKKITADTRNQTFAWLRANSYKFIPSVSNCFMIDTGRNGKEVIAAMQSHNVYIGRTWPIWPNSVRITVGTPQEMAKFQTAFAAVMNTTKA
ncbi:MAG: pyridoxal phosphate-dependent aminotransferase [Acidobacteriota bacterium]|nr:pyridoxal phosphate-dependent aminotransferase [Acidobacteriota bacterium]